MEKETSHILKNELKYCGNKYPEQDSLEIMKNDGLDPIKLQVNEICSRTFDGNEDDQNHSKLSNFIKDDYVHDFHVYTKRDNKSLVSADDPILKLDKLIQNFKDLFIGEGSHTSGNESAELKPEASTINCLEGKKETSTEDETEGYILEHKSISHPISGDYFQVSKNSSSVQNTFKIFKENTKITELVTIHEDAGKYVFSDEINAAGKSGLSNFKNRQSECVYPFEVSCKLSQQKDLDFFKDILVYNTLKLNILSPKSSSIKEIKKYDFPCPLVKCGDYSDEKNMGDNTKSLEILQHDNGIEIYTNTKSDNDIGNDILNLTEGDISSAAERVFILENDVKGDIHEAIRCDDESLLQQLLARGADPNEPDWEGKGDPPIVQAALKQNISIVKALCEARCDVNLTSVRGETALHMVVSRRPVSLPLLNTLLAAGCDANMQDKLRGCSPLHSVSGFADDEPEVFLKLVAVTDVNLRDHRHSTVLHRVAATSNNVMWIKQLLELGADLSVQNDRGETPLCVALERGWEEGALALVAGGTDLCRTNLYRETALHVAARHDQAKVVAALLRNSADVNAQDLAGNTALHLAAGRGYVATVHQLLSCPHLDLDTHNSDNATPLSCAVESGFISVVQMLLGAEQVDLQPALDVAKQGYRRLSQPEMCQLLTKELARRQTPHLT